MALLALSVLLGDRPAALVTVIQTTAADADPVAILLNYGALGILVVLVLTGQLRTKAEVRALEKQIEHQAAEIAAKDELIRAFQLQLTGHTLPALAQTARVIESVPDSESAMVARLSDLTARLEELAKGETP